MGLDVDANKWKDNDNSTIAKYWSLALMRLLDLS